MVIKIKKLTNDAIVPSYARYGDAGMDVYAIEEAVLKPGERKLISTGLAFEIPYGTELQVRPRSGLALKQGISIVNSPGTLDYGYRGELKILLINLGEENFEVKKEDRIAQVVLNRIEITDIEEVDELSETERGEGGFGSTGLK